MATEGTLCFLLLLWNATGRNEEEVTTLCVRHPGHEVDRGGLSS